ncbi:hypothetical protein PERMA_1376 [Persephonella marina EX-H1]|uniref:Uncharacterized protein n=1 Tax=Persephonella marina (strain DSM 14350 / EX-H1) TaxID=123214 RepID=C0QR49_PERMH|nr:hypothetical protein PERMA_1376 [Persephonella marina EX-H1]
MHINSDYRRKKEEILSALKKEKSLLEGQGGDNLEKAEKIESIENDVLLGVVANLKRDESDVADFGSLSKGKFIIDTSTGKTTLFGIRSVIKSKKALERLPESNYENYLNVKKALEFSVANYSYLVLSDVFDRISNLMVNDISSEGREKAEQFLIDNRKYRYGLNMIESIMDLSSKYGNDPDITKALLAVYLSEEEDGQLEEIKEKLYTVKGVKKKKGDTEKDNGEGNKEPDSYEYKILQELEKIKESVNNALESGSGYEFTDAEEETLKGSIGIDKIDENTSLQEVNNLIEKKIKEIREKQEKTEKRIEEFINELEEKLKNETPEEKAVKRQIVREILDSLNIKEVSDPVSLIDEEANFHSFYST